MSNLCKCRRDKGTSAGRNSPALARVLLPALLLGMAACTTPKHLPPPSFADMGLADSYGAATLPDAPAPDLANWWQSFDDPVLDALIERGRNDNLDVQEARRADRKRGATDTPDRLRRKIEAEIARTYVTLRLRQALIENTHDFLAQRQVLIQLARFRVQAGLVPPLDVARAVAGRDMLAVRIPELEARNLQDAGRIAVLTGQTPQALSDLLDGAAQIPTGPTDVALGRPSDLPIPAQAINKRAILKAVQAVEAQNTAFQSAKQREIALTRAVTTTEAAAKLARKAYAEGLADYSTLEQVEANLLSTRDALRQAQARRALKLIGLYVALRGDAGPVTADD